MNTPIISFNAKLAPDFNNYSPLLPAKLKNNTRQTAYMLAQEIRNPIGHINLSVEMLESMIADKDLKMYLTIIKRNSIRISHLINEFLTDRQSDDVQAEKYSIHQFPDKG